MLTIKPGARILGLKNEMLLGVFIVNSVYEEFNLDCRITCGINGVHSPGSLHYTGNAVDFGVHNIAAEVRSEVHQAIKNALQTDFDVIWEKVGTPEEHFHVEYQPKVPYK